MLDALARRYGKLPSQLLRSADSLDIMVFDVAVSYEEMLHSKQSGKVNPNLYNQEDLQKVWDNR